MTAREAMLQRRSWSTVTDAAPSHDELRELVVAAGRVADHKSLRPWRLIELRGSDRDRLGRALSTARGESGIDTKPHRAPLLIAVVASYAKGDKVPRWEQQAVASGVAHSLSLVLDEAGWGVFWRTAGAATRSRAVAEAHGLGNREELLGWLYVGGRPERRRGGDRMIDPDAHLSRMPH